jgi:hypothetical protein
MRRRLFVVVAAPAVAALVLVACSGGSASSPAALDSGAVEQAPDADAGDACTQLPLPDGPVVHVTGTVLEKHADAGADGGDGGSKPIADAMITVEYGGLYLPYCDLSRASPYYVFGAVTDSNGHFEMDAKVGQLGFHSFATGYYYSRAALDSASETHVDMTMEPLPADQKKPTTVNAVFDKTTVAPGERVTFSSTITTWDSKDPLSDENVLTEPKNSWGLELDPPSTGKKDDFPDGLWKRSFNAPTTPGTYTYWFSATTAYCVTSDVIKATLTVQ